MSSPFQTAAPIRSPLLRTVETAIVESGGSTSLIQALLREQQTLTAVEKFSRAHDACPAPAQEKYYRDLIPLERPRPGQQYAFEVDLDVCTGCKACVAACHSLNGLEGPEVWRTVGLLHGGTVEEPVQRTVTTSCHHCVDPSCLAGCPVRAYEKDPVTGVVKHLDDQCIGCQYCTLMCPYDAPKYNADLGIVRKCDMCTDRMSGGEAPACVQGCPNGAIRIRVVDQVQALQASAEGTFLPGAAAPDHTVPTTVYKSKNPAPNNLLPADFYSVSPEHAHTPLVILLVLTQLAAGAYATAFVGKQLLPVPQTGPWAFAQAGFSLFLVLVALAASVFHLGRPLGAWRVFLGLGTSWMSREAIAFGVFAKVGVLFAGSVLAARFEPYWGQRIVAIARPLLEGATAGLGLLGVFCSIMIYVVTRRTHWRAAMTATKFVGTTVVLGAATVLMVSRLAAGLLPEAVRASTMEPLSRGLLLVVAVGAGIKLIFEALQLRHYRDRDHTVPKRVAIVMLRDLKQVTVARFLCGGIGGLLLPLVALGRLDTHGVGPGTVIAVFVLLLSGELCERSMFFKAAPPSRMPGALS